MHVVVYLDRIAKILEPKEAGEGGKWRLGTVEEDGEGQRQGQFITRGSSRVCFVFCFFASIVLI